MRIEEERSNHSTIDGRSVAGKDSGERLTNFQNTSPTVMDQHHEEHVVLFTALALPSATPCTFRIRCYWVESPDGGNQRWWECSMETA